MSKLFLGLCLCFCLVGSYASASHGYARQLEMIKQEIENISCKSEDDKSIRESIIKANISRLERIVQKKAKRLLCRLNTYKDCLNNSEDGEEAQRWAKKLTKVEAKLQDLNEVLFGIEVLKMRIEN